SRPELIEALNAGFAEAMGERFRPLVAGRDVPAAGTEAHVRGDRPAVELLIADKEGEWASPLDGLAAPWRLGEARALAGRVGELLGEDWAPRDVVLLTRATTDLRAYERALE